MADMENFYDDLIIINLYTSMAQNEKYNISNAWSFKISHFFYALMATAIDLENTI